MQSTAAEVRAGFPYFAHHDSVSALWIQKWRKPCAHGIYPFTDANVEDFDSIFAELVRTSGDQPDILYRPDEYARPFFPMAEKLVATAEQAEAKGDTAQARDLYLRAAAVYRIARFPINRSPVSQEAWERGKAAYVKGGQYLSPPSVPVDIPFTRADESAGDRNVPIQAYLACLQASSLRTAGPYCCSSAGWMLTKPTTPRARRPTSITVLPRSASRSREPATVRRLPTTRLLQTAS